MATLARELLQKLLLSWSIWIDSPNKTGYTPVGSVDILNVLSDPTFVGKAKVGHGELWPRLV